MQDRSTDFEFLPIDVSLGRCFRYYQFVGGVADASFAVGMSDTSTTSIVEIDFKTIMRTAPTVAISGTLNITDNANYNSAVSAISATLGNYGGRLNLTHASTATAKRTAFLNPTSTTPDDNGVTLSAEL